jgi:vacuolar-type H+-ATPase subunit I/STV1
MTNKNEDTETEAVVQSNGETQIEVKAATEALRERIAQLEEGIASRDAELADLKESLASAVTKYRTAVLAAATGVPEELIKGETIEEIDNSLETARGMVAQIRQQLETDAAANSIPAGAPTRTGPNVEGLTGEAKIKIALMNQPK